MTNGNEAAYAHGELRFNGENKPTWFGEPGLTKREYFAATTNAEEVPTWSNVSIAKFLGIADIPDFATDPIGNIQAIEQAKAKMKVISADALIQQLNKTL